MIVELDSDHQRRIHRTVHGDLRKNRLPATGCRLSIMGACLPLPYIQNRPLVPLRKSLNWTDSKNHVPVALWRNPRADS
jgi:hypothetical protein